MSWIFGLTGSLDYSAINAAISAVGANRTALYVAFVFMLAGFGYKMAFAPFHMWSPDVYQGAPIPFTAFLSVASNAAGAAILIRFFYPGVSTLTQGGNWAFPQVGWTDLLMWLSIVTMTLGNLSALNQRNLKRLLAYSGIAHAGYVMMGLVALTVAGLNAILFYIVVYLIMNLGAFLVVMVIANATGREEIEAYRGLARRGGAFAAVCMAVFLFSLTGLPPTAGFIGKFLLLASIIQGHFYLLAVIALLNTVISLYYYMRIVKVMFLDEPIPTDPPIRTMPSAAPVLGVFAVLTIAFGLYWTPLLSYTQDSLVFFMK
jgi:NADH-quinone oxidoreductase subunit N